MYYVYLIRSLRCPTQTYIGYTVNLKQRLETHNSGGSTSTEPYRPWKIVAYFAFPTQAKALAFEKYLKSGSGTSFAKRHLW